ncbi:MAG: CocE/NonD family hydrolase [Chloracidobacterium sp.]|nr:CocE/NonD family hydrolase [Chloracidobacterium sp.]
MVMFTRLAIVTLLAPCLAFAQPKETPVPMRDGVRLATDLYFPSDPSNGLPVVLERTPYNNDFWPSAEFWTARGYGYAIQDVRGRFRSEGRFEPFLREGPDGFNTIEGLARQALALGQGRIVQWQACQAIRRRAPAHSATIRWSPGIANCWRSAKISSPIAAFRILGPMSAVIYVSSDAPETDLFVAYPKRILRAGISCWLRANRGSGSR